MTSNAQSTSTMVFNDWAYYNNRLPMVISAAKRLRVKAVDLTAQAKINPQDKKLQKAAIKASDMAVSRSLIADEVARVLGRRVNWRDEAEKPDYTKKNWYEK